MNELKKEAALRVAAFYGSSSLEELRSNEGFALDATDTKVPVFNASGVYLTDVERSKCECLPRHYLTPMRIALLIREELRHG